MKKSQVNLEDYYFPVKESKNIIVPKTTDLIDPENHEAMSYTLEGYKAILREDTQEVISIRGTDYQLIPNQEVIETAMNEIDKTGLEYKLNPTYSFADNKKMKLAVEFPGIQFDEADQSKNGQKTNFATFIHNSYDGSSGVNVMFGGIRVICTNGMIFQKILNKINIRHQGYTFLSHLQEKINDSIQAFPQIQNRIQEMESESAPENLYNQIETKIGKQAAEAVAPSPELIQEMSMWAVYNLLTRYAGHHISKRQATQKQMAISRMFNL